MPTRAVCTATSDSQTPMKGPTNAPPKIAAEARRSARSLRIVEPASPRTAAHVQITIIPTVIRIITADNAGKPSARAGLDSTRPAAWHSPAPRPKRIPRVKPGPRVSWVALARPRSNTTQATPANAIAIAANSGKVSRSPRKIQANSVPHSGESDRSRIPSRGPIRMYA